MRISDWSSDVCSSDLVEGLVHVFRQMEEIAEVGEKDRRVVWIEDRDARLDAVKPGTGGKLAFQAVGDAIDVEGSSAGRRLVAQIADEDRPVGKTAVDLGVQGQLDDADAGAVPILGQLRLGI